MKLREVGSIIFISVIVLSAGYAIFNKIKPEVVPDDNFAEEFLEERLEAELGLADGTIDLTPESEEK